MSQGTMLLDEALELARKEKTALENEAYEEAIELARKRTEITGMAWNEYDIEEKDPYHKKLVELASFQTQLSELAGGLHEAIRQKLMRSRKEKQRIHGYHVAVNQAMMMQ